MTNGILGLVIGFIVGLIVNAILLRRIPKTEYLTNKNLRIKYGALNWGFALLGLVIGLFFK